MRLGADAKGRLVNRPLKRGVIWQIRVVKLNGWERDFGVGRGVASAFVVFVVAEEVDFGEGEGIVVD